MDCGVRGRRTRRQIGGHDGVEAPILPHGGDCPRNPLGDPPVEPLGAGQPHALLPHDLAELQRYIQRHSRLPSAPGPARLIGSREPGVRASLGQHQGNISGRHGLDIAESVVAEHVFIDRLPPDEDTPELKRLGQRIHFLTGADEGQVQIDQRRDPGEIALHLGQPRHRKDQRAGAAPTGVQQAGPRYEHDLAIQLRLAQDGLDQLHGKSRPCLVLLGAWGHRAREDFEVLGTVDGI